MYVLKMHIAMVEGIAPLYDGSSMVGEEVRW